MSKFARLAAVSVTTFLLGSPAHAQNQSPPPCSSPEHRQFDFWVGEWDVYNSQGQLVGQNSIERTLGFCVLEENWEGASGSVGSSFNIYDRSHGVWHQTWVDRSGTLLLLEGGIEDDKMIMRGTTVGPSGAETLNRITWEPLEDGRVRQTWDVSNDDGENWQTIFDGFYQRRD